MSTYNDFNFLADSRPQSADEGKAFVALVDRLHGDSATYKDDHHRADETYMAPLPQRLSRDSAQGWDDVLTGAADNAESGDEVFEDAHAWFSPSIADRNSMRDADFFEMAGPDDLVNEQSSFHPWEQEDGEAQGISDDQRYDVEESYSGNQDDDCTETGLQLADTAEFPGGEADDPEPQYSDLFQSAFGEQADRVQDDDNHSIMIIDPEDEDEVSNNTGGQQRERRTSTPPPPTVVKFEDYVQSTKTTFAHASRAKDDLGILTRNTKEQGRLRQGPDVDRDLSSSLRAHFKFHERAAQFIPRLPNHELFDWSRRYWIAVLVDGKRPRNANSEKDFIWMKGCKYSTVATVFHHYATTAFTNKDDLVLLLGHEKVEMEDQMQHLNYFSDRLVVFRAVTRDHADAAGKSLVHGIEPQVIEILD